MRDDIDIPRTVDLPFEETCWRCGASKYNKCPHRDGIPKPRTSNFNDELKKIGLHYKGKWK